MQYNHELDRYQIKSADSLRNCMRGGNGVVCLVAPTLKAHTYRFKKPRNEDKFPDDVVFVYVLHESAYYYIGMIEGNSFRLTQNSRFIEDTESVRGAKYLMRMINEEGFFEASPMRVYHHGKCAVCGRKMRSAKAIMAGVGPKCLRRLQAKLNVQ